MSRVASWIRGEMDQVTCAFPGIGFGQGGWYRGRSSVLRDVVVTGDRWVSIVPMRIAFRPRGSARFLAFGRGGRTAMGSNVSVRIIVCLPREKMTGPLIWILVLGCLDAIFWRCVSQGMWGTALAVGGFEVVMVSNAADGGMGAAQINLAWNMISIVFTYTLLEPGFHRDRRKLAAVILAIGALTLASGDSPVRHQSLFSRPT